MHDSTDNILTVRLFGSHARGEADEGSDVDILVVVHDASNSPSNLALPNNTDVSLYSAERIASMFAEGHLFAWHLYLESVPYGSLVHDDWFKSLGRPSEYKEASLDLEQFVSILEESLDSLDRGHNYIFEAGICHLALRNIGMILSHIEKGRPDFSRYAAIRLPAELRPPDRPRTVRSAYRLPAPLKSRRLQHTAAFRFHNSGYSFKRPFVDR
ncbi:hypothetical protein OJJOAM_002202 [Cupriavidus sp. H18C1]|uniref:nucleotidyltransferase domain-containing protein n=1 Tax=Cupriavidus sp. H18C1 TaxID=3241601 RepID=UPI003BB94377